MLYLVLLNLLKMKARHWGNANHDSVRVPKLENFVYSCRLETRETIETLSMVFFDLNAQLFCLEIVGANILRTVYVY